MQLIKKNGRILGSGTLSQIEKLKIILNPTSQEHMKLTGSFNKQSLEQMTDFAEMFRIARQ